MTTFNEWKSTMKTTTETGLKAKLTGADTSDPEEILNLPAKVHYFEPCGYFTEDYEGEFYVEALNEGIFFAAHQRHKAIEWLWDNFVSKEID